MSKAIAAARRILDECGIDDATEIPLKLLVAGRGATLLETPMKNADGRIVHGKHRSIIKINSNISYEGRRRFAIAHELGHFELHKDYPIHNDSKSLDWFDDALKKLKTGKQEFEANEFATELLMPKEVFLKEARYKPFSPQLLRDLADRFQTSITSVAYRYRECNLHPICLFFTNDGAVKYWKKSDDFKLWIPDCNKLPPPEDSVAMEYVENNYQQIYKRHEAKQDIYKSTWFDVKDSQEDTPFYEYCIATTKYKNILSVVWED